MDYRGGAIVKDCNRAWSSKIILFISNRFTIILGKGSEFNNLKICFFQIIILNVLKLFGEESYEEKNEPHCVRFKFF